MKLPENKVELVKRGNKVVYDLGDKIVKVFNETKPLSDVFNEALNLARINECGIPSPQVLQVSEIENGGGWAMETTKIPGTVMAEKMQAEPGHFYEYLEQFVDLLIEIHSYRCQQLNRQKDKYSRMIKSLDGIDGTTRYNLLERLDGMKKDTCVCHGDFNPTNIIIGEDGKLYVCDWAHATQGEPAADAAMTYLLLSIQDKQQADTFLEMYCDRSATPMQVVRQWMPVVAASELARNREGQDRDALLSWVDVVDYQ